MPLAPINVFTGFGLIPVYPDRARRQNVALAANKSYLRGTVLGEQIGASQVNTVTISATGGTFTLSINGVATTALAWNATSAAVQAALLAVSPSGANAIETITLGGTPTGGTFTLAYGGEVSAPIAYNATAAVVQTALTNLATIGAGNATVSGSAGGPYTVTFAGELAGLPSPGITASAAQLQPSTATATVAIVATGGASGQDEVVTGSAGGPYTIAFQGGLNNQVVTLTSNPASLTGGSGTATVASVTAGSPGTPGTFIAYSAGATDGSQVPKGILEFDVVTDSLGNITFGQQAGGGQFGQTEVCAPVFMTGDFYTHDLIGLDQNALVAGNWRLLSGVVDGKGIVRLP